MKTDAGGSATAPPTEGLASVYIPSLTDGFGDRLLMFDNTDGDPLEMLRFHATLVDTPGFEQVLRERVRRLERLTHTAFPTIRAVKRLESDGALVLVSTYAPGKRLSALLAEPRVGTGLHPASVAWIVTQVVQPLSILESEGEHFAHGALTADRIILTDDGRVRIAEHVLGSALGHLNRSPARLWQEFGVLVRPDSSGMPHFDARTDIFQVGVLALSMLLAQRITPADVERRLPLLLDEWSRSTSMRSRPFADSLRLWIERALQVGDRSYCSAAEAYGELCRLPDASVRRPFTFLHAGNVNELSLPPATLPPAAQTGEQRSQTPHEQQSDTGADTASPAAGRAASDNVTRGAAEIPQVHAGPAESRPGPMESRPSPAEVRPKLSTFAAHHPAKVPRAPHRAKPARRDSSRWARHAVPIAAAFATLAVLEAIVIATMLLRERPAEAADAGAALSSPSSGVASQTGSEVQPAGAGAGAAGRRQQRGVAASPLNGRQDAGAAGAAIARAANNQRSGGVRLTAPIELEVLLGDRVLGSSADGPIVTSAGTHELDFINASLGFRTRRTVTFRAGEITTLSVPVPPGRISVNAEPWAEVWIDNQSVGETPLAHLEVPVGEHQVIFRHPDFGERRQHVIVRADEVTRASTTFDR